MRTSSKVLIGGAALLLVFTFFFPIWTISLNAPQYPEGLGLNIWINQITGLKPNDLQNINGLNHYIGMKHITPESIPELQIMPYIVIFLIAFGLITAYTGKLNMLKAWIIMFIILAVVGLIDFYLWEYNYGHQLNPDAPIKVPGMTYQPPLIGSKQLLNITAVSLPYIGSFVIFLSLLISIFVIFYERARKKIGTK